MKWDLSTSPPLPSSQCVHSKHGLNLSLPLPWISGLGWTSQERSRKVRRSCLIGNEIGGSGCQRCVFSTWRRRLRASEGLRVPHSHLIGFYPSEQPVFCFLLPTMGFIHSTHSLHMYMYRITEFSRNILPCCGPCRQGGNRIPPTQKDSRCPCYQGGHGVASPQRRRDRAAAAAFRCQGCLSSSQGRQQPKA